MRKNIVVFLLCLAVWLGCAGAGFAEDLWTAGFAAAEIDLPADGILYIAGYHNGQAGVPAPEERAKAACAYLEADQKGFFLLSVDAIAFSRKTVQGITAQIMAKIPDAEVHLCATHCHALPDTLGLWGPVGLDGKNETYMENLSEACVMAACQAYENRTAGRLYLGQIRTGTLQKDSRAPEVYDDALYQLRFASTDGGGRLVIYAAHAESMRGGNTLLSRDFPGVLADTVLRETGDPVLFLSGAAGGLIMTEELTDAGRDPVGNRDRTGEQLAALLLSITDEREIPPAFTLGSTEVTVPMDNPVFLLYKYLGILGSKITAAQSETGYGVVTPVSWLRMGDTGIVFLPGEPFPELISGQALAAADPPALADIARRAGIETLLTVTLCDDEIGYIIPPSQFLVDEKLPFIQRKKDETGEDHYEETNSVGIRAAECLAQAFEQLVFSETGGNTP